MTVYLCYVQMSLYACVTTVHQRIQFWSYSIADADK